MRPTTALPAHKSGGTVKSRADRGVIFCDMREM
jgi:hypothetical protein